ncbi:angiopoietin-related protein 4-like [Littorina saxatilis]|uniref:angiopoietin-related protein 4-like n=1 Tax=Littorina saxatilis TaxID=31220 RepID=UPI0038B6927C
MVIQCVISDCKDIGNTGQTEKRPYLIHPPASPAPFPVFCIPNLGRTYVFEQKKGDVDFNRPWQDYVHGFGQVSGDHWLGLDHVRHLTLNEGKNYGLKFTLTLFNGTKVYVLYSDFKLGGADTGYTFTMNPNVPNRSPGDCLSPLVGAPFSTYDNDRDNSTSINCAQQQGGGWWYSGDTCSSTINNQQSKQLFIPTEELQAKIETMLTKLATVCLGFVFLVDASFIPASEDVRNKRAEVELKLNGSDMSYPPTEDELKAVLKQAADALQEAAHQVEDPNSNVTMESFLKRDVQPVASLAEEAVNLSPAEDDHVSQVKRKRRGVSVRVRVSARWGKKKRSGLTRSVSDIGRPFF